VNTHSATFRVPARADAFEAALEGLTRVNEGLMQRENIPTLYEAGVRYRDEPRDVWRHALDVAGEKWGDCEDLAAYRAAELRHTGEDPGAYVTTYQSGPARYHAVVARSGGLVEDPSRVLGMGQKKTRTNMRHSANIVGDDPLPGDAITFEVIRLPGGWGKRAGYRGYLRLPLGTPPGALTPQALMTVGPLSATPAAATQAAAQSAAKALLTNPAVSAALSLVPGGAAASQTIQAAAPLLKKIPGLSKIF
jgi:hypothetical protein